MPWGRGERQKRVPEGGTRPCSAWDLRPVRVMEPRRRDGWLRGGVGVSSPCEGIALDPGIAEQPVTR